MALAQQQNDSFEVLWKQVEQLEQEALTQSARQVVETIRAKAEKEKNSAQIVKALLYSSKYAMTLEEDAQLNVVNNFRSEIAKAEYPTKNILESYLANLYWQFFQQNRYQFYNRSKTVVKVDSVDFRTWDLTTLFHEITSHFEASLENESLLLQTPISKVDVLLNQQEGSEDYRPTLFDVLAQNALAFYTTNENSITRPADTFEIDDPEFLCEGSRFTQLDLAADMGNSLQSKALCLYQKLLLHHEASKKPYAFAEVDLQRLRFIFANAVFENKEQRYLEVLQNTAQSRKDEIASSLYLYEVAALYQQQGNRYHPVSDQGNRWKLKEALDLCEKVMKDYPNSRGAEKCKSLKAQLLAHSLQLTTEKHIPIDQNSRLLVNYKNYDGLLLTARTITTKQWTTLEDLYPQEKKLAYIKKLPIARSWEASLKNENDYQSHSTEILMPPLANGQYLILALPKDNKDKTFAYTQVQATNLALVETQSETHQNFQVIDRTHGKPIEGARMTFRYRINYDGKRLSQTFVTDKSGTVALKRMANEWSDISISVRHEKDVALYGDYYMYRAYRTSQTTPTYSCFLFTDRSIYRPGQTVFFKGIALQGNPGSSSVLEQAKVSVQLNDVNGQLVHEADFTTNAYGSFSGEFILPTTSLTGQFSIQVRSGKYPLGGYTSFSVEEYKRPKFETSFEPVKETYAVNDSVQVHGTAMAYAGSAISGAKVSYRVKRSVTYPRWYHWGRILPNSSPQEIAHGETRTDDSGTYTIVFKALPDNHTDKESRPTFRYVITADVTDINGETHSTSTHVTVGYHTLTAHMSLANLLDKDFKGHELFITTNNLNGQFVAAQGTVKMYKLKAPERVLRPRNWAAPDYKGFSKQTFEKLFPHDAFDKEHDPSTWEKGKLVWQSDFDTGKSTRITFPSMKKWFSGKYLLELQSSDQHGREVKDVLQTTLFSTNDEQLADNQLFHIKTDQSNYEIGDRVNVRLSSNVANLYVTVNIEKDHKVIDTQIIRLNKSTYNINIPVRQEDLGGFALTYSYAAYNHFNTGVVNIPVPYPSTDLQLETVTFRDKLQPGTDETWSFKIKGPQGDKVAAELLASMYDASLDSFRPHYWGFNPLVRPTYYSNRRSNAYRCFAIDTFSTYQDNVFYSHSDPSFDTFNWFGLYFGQHYRHYSMNRRSRLMRNESAPVPAGAAMGMTAVEEVEDAEAGAPMEMDTSFAVESKKNQPVIAQTGETNANGSTDGVQIRKNLQETAFFFPQLHTDKDGNVSFSFTTPEALTQWNLQLLAHTKTLESGYRSLQTVTQKELMVIPNVPRFLREGDEILLSTKIANLTVGTLKGHAQLQVTDAVSGVDISNNLLVTPQGETALPIDQREFDVDSMNNTQVSWRLKIPKGLQAVQYRVIAKAGNFSDGEQNVLPVLTNRMLVTESIPMWVRSNQTKTFTLEKLRTVNSATLTHHKLTLEVISNPAWYAVQALPYLMEYPYECNEQTFSRYYANTLAAHIANSSPAIRTVFDQWAQADALLSNLEKNPELKSLLIQETPWLRDAQSETEQKKRIALLFDMNKMRNEQQTAWNKLKQNQKGSGAWAWFNGGPDNRFITQHIVTGIGHLKQLRALPESVEDLQSLVQNALRYLDSEFVNEYKRMKRHATDIDQDHLSQTQIHYLYMRSFFTQFKASKQVEDIQAYYRGQAQKYWKNKNLYSRGMLALITHRSGDTKTSAKILRALEENSIRSEELGMYWKENTDSWFWYQAPIETQALLIEVFSEIRPTDVDRIDNLKIWLLKNKQTNQWKTTKATTEAVYALLLQGSDWLDVTDAVDLVVGGETFGPSQMESIPVEAGTGYYKTAWNGTEIKPQMAEVQLTKKGQGIAWGALYWQYFEDLDQITTAKTPLQLKKKLFLKRNTKMGEELSEITDTTDVEVGDLVRVRMELKADRPMEFVHMKDMRAAGLEPINVFSTYKWQDGLGYYEATKDASTNFFFDYLPKGVFVFEYDLRVNNAGNFSNGITTIQSMYAPEFSSHSEGIRLKIN